MIDKIDKSLRELLTALQTAKLYGPTHPITLRSVEKAYLSLRDVLVQREEFVIGIIGEELAFEKEVFFDLSRLLKQMIVYLKNRGIERISFKSALQEEEVSKFIEILSRPKDEVKSEYADLLSLSGIRNINIGKVKGSLQKGAGGGEGDGAGKGYLIDTYQSSLEKVSVPLTRMLNKEALDGLDLKLAMNGIFENLTANYQQLLKLVSLKRHDAATFTHLLNVSILSMHFSSRLGFSKDVVMDIGISALFHDIGKLYISREIIAKPDRLSAEEFAQVESHTTLGAKLLLQYVDNIGVMPVVASFEHHIKFDLSGYPKHPYTRKQNIVSSIVSICDVYDALSERRSYKADYPPDAIYNLMLRTGNSAFEPGLLEDFFKIMGVWPIGTIVALSDKRVAVVVEENQEAIFNPVVKIISTQPQEVIDLGERKDITIDHYLNSWREGKEFMHLI